MLFSKCSKCGAKFSRKSNFCPECGEPKKKNLAYFFVRMLILFIIVQIVTTLIPSLLAGSILSYKYGIEFMVESIWCLMILIVMLLSGNSYVFTQKKEKFWKSIVLGAPLLGMALVMLPSSIDSARGVNFGVLINLVLYCAAIGIAEEFLCRGWVQNEFLERFGKNRKQVILSIVLSSFIFGGMHISNIWNADQSVFETFLQVIQATASGSLLGSVYYRTKNIWSVAFLHGFYDFSILLGEVNVIKACTTGEPTSSIVLYHMISSSLIIAFYVISTMILLRKSKVDKILNNKQEPSIEEYLKESKYTKNLQIALIVIGISLFLPIGNNEEDLENYYTCYSYDEKEIGTFDEHYSNYKNYKIHYSTISLTTGVPLNYQLEVFYDEKVGIKNVTTGDILYFNYENVYAFDVIDNGEEFIILIYDYDQNPILYYMRMEKEKLSNNWETLQDIKTSFQSYDLPALSRIGYLTLEDDDYKYPYMISSNGESFMIDEKDDLYLLR